MKLEIKKFKLWRNIKGVIIANICLVGLFMMMGIISVYEQEQVFMDFPFTALVADALIRATFIIYSSVLLAELVIEEYKSKTMNVMFMYPLNRKKILLAKFMIVITFGFINIVMSNIIILVVMGIADQFFDMIPGTLTINLLVSTMPNIIIGGVASALMSLIPLYFGIKKMSSSTVIVAAIILVALTCSVNSEMVINMIVPTLVGIGVVSVLVGGCIIKRLENQDVL